ncbi:phosphoglycerate mutase-like protein 4 isoform X1 [Durio zibethinus]|uniref:Phosphoglycerate mutase-like protein 4 isoform X1 n=1 Tax=Durio zibethinus TaxID=66656 RepID=A0A6P6BDN9_DURZI|nr:phosphoglycerate mutase-like protein 4 isoform X1 [Durio zibethinus]
MSALRTKYPLAECLHSPHFSSGSVKIPVYVQFPSAIKTLHRNNVPKQSLSFSRRSTQLVKPAYSLPMSDSNSSCVDGAYAEIVVVRHGETEWNADGRIQGHLDVELNEAGREQAASVADRLSKEPKISAVYSSDLKRALVTAETIAARCGGLEVITDPDLRERNLGDLQGLVYREAAKLSPKAYKAFSSHRTDQDIPGGGESLDQLYHRCTSSLQRIGRKHKGERVVVVSHGGVIRSLNKRACPNGKSAGKVLNTSVNIFHLSDEQWTIKSWGDVSHLDQTGYLKSGFGGDKTSG